MWQRGSRELDVLDEAATGPSLPSAQIKVHAETRFQRARVTLSWPLDNLGPSLPNLVATVAGNLFELKQFSGLRLLDIRLPPSLCDRLSGAAVRRRRDAPARGRRGTAADRHHHQAERRLRARPRRRSWSTTCAEAGIDFIKDDELQSDGPALPVRRARRER